MRLRLQPGLVQRGGSWSVRGDFEVLSQRPLRPGTSQGRVVTGKEYVITAFTVGDWWRVRLWDDLEGWAQKAGLQEV